jgi:hypothetical protein
VDNQVANDEGAISIHGSQSTNGANIAAPLSPSTVEKVTPWLKAIDEQQAAIDAYEHENEQAISSDINNVELPVTCATPISEAQSVLKSERLVAAQVKQTQLRATYTKVFQKKKAKAHNSKTMTRKKYYLYVNVKRYGRCPALARKRSHVY